MNLLYSRKRKTKHVRCVHTLNTLNTLVLWIDFFFIFYLVKGWYTTCLPLGGQLTPILIRLYLALMFPLTSFVSFLRKPNYEMELNLNEQSIILFTCRNWGIGVILVMKRQYRKVHASRVVKVFIKWNVYYVSNESLF